MDALQGVGCGVGFGFGWGIFLLGLGAPVKRGEDLLGITDRMMHKKMEQIRRDRAAGIKPYGHLPEELSTSDPFLDRIIRTMLVRRAKRKQDAPRKK